MLKDCNEMTRDVLARRDAYQKKRSRWLRIAAGTAAGILLCCAAVFAFAPEKQAPGEKAIDGGTIVSAPAPEQTAPGYALSLFVNEIDKNTAGALRADVDIQVVSLPETETIPQLQFLKELELPETLREGTVYAVYVRSERDIPEYDCLYEYRCQFSDPNSEKELSVAFSSRGKPIRDYLFDEEGARVSRINGVEMTVFRYEDTLYTEFTAGGLFFDLEAHGLSEQEFALCIAEILQQCC